MTGQIVHIIPVILGVLISNAVCQSLQPSIYDSIIEIKKLPYLPPIASSNSISHKILVKDFMNTNLPFVWKEKCSYADLKALLSTHRKIISFPLVESPQSMKLLGSVARPDLLKLLYVHLGRERRLQEVCRRNSDTLAPALQLLNTISGRLDGANGERAAKPVEQPLALADQPAADSKGACEPKEAAREDLRRDAEDENGDDDDDDDEGGIEFKRSLDSSRDVSASTELPAAAAEPSKRLELDERVRERILERNCNTDARDASRLIIGAGGKQPAHNNYGATGMEHRPVGAGQQQRPTGPLGEEQLLSECQKHLLAHEEEEFKQFSGVARMINHYDRGSSMDEDLLDESIQQIEGHLAKVVSQRPPEIVVVVASSQSQSSASTLPPSPASPLSPSDAKNALQLPGAMAANESGRPPRHAISRVVESQPTSINRQPQPPPRMREVAASYGQPPTSSAPSLSSRPTKSILKTSSFNNNLAKRSLISPSHSFGSSYDSKLMLGHHYSNPMSNIKFTLAPDQQRASDQKRVTLGSLELGCQSTSEKQQDDENAAQPVRQRRKVILPRLRVVDMTPEEQEQWEKEQLNAYICITKCQIDEAPFQLVEQTSLYRVHTLFSMLGLNHAYVTSFGRLVGIVALKDIRYAIEKMLQDN